MTSRAPSQIIIDRFLLTGFLTMFPTGGAALLLAQTWEPLVYLFWVAWPLATIWLLRHTRIGIHRCRHCLTTARISANRCRSCGLNLD